MVTSTPLDRRTSIADDASIRPKRALILDHDWISELKPNHSTARRPKANSQMRRDSSRQYHGSTDSPIHQLRNLHHAHAPRHKSNHSSTLHISDSDTPQHSRTTSRSYVQAWWVQMRQQRGMVGQALWAMNCQPRIPIITTALSSGYTHQLIQPVLQRLSGIQHFSHIRRLFLLLLIRRRLCLSRLDLRSGKERRGWDIGRVGPLSLCQLHLDPDLQHLLMPTSNSSNRL